jgi:hypothetical protein
VPLDLDAARKLVTPIYDALTRPGEKDVEALIKSVTAADFQSCSHEGECVDQAAAITRFKGLASVIADLNGTIKELFVSGEDTIIVRAGQPAHRSRPLWGQSRPGEVSAPCRLISTRHPLKDPAFLPCRELDGGLASAPKTDYIGEEETLRLAERAQVKRRSADSRYLRNA